MEIFGAYPAWMAVVALLGGFIVFASECSGRNRRPNGEEWDERLD